MVIKILPFATLSTIAFTGFAYAGGPSIINKCALNKIVHPNNSSGIAFDEECNNAYVLPQSVGNVSVTSVQQNLNLGFCPALKNEQKSIFESTKIRQGILTKINKLIADYEPLKSETDALYSKMSKKKAEYIMASKILDDVKLKNKKLSDEIDEAKMIYDNYYRINPDAQNTKEAKIRFDKLVNEYNIFINGEFYKAQKDYYRAKKDYDFASDEYTYSNNKYLEAIAPLLSLQKQADDLAESAMRSYQRYVVLEGLSAQILFNVDTNKVVQGYQSLNPELKNITWQAMPIKSSIFYASLKDSQSVPDPTTSVLIDSSIPGVITQTVKNIDTTQAPPTLNEKESNNTQPFGSVSGKVRLNLAGACVYYENVNKPVLTENINNISANLELNVNYTYQLKARRSFHAKYNLYNMLSKIEKKSSSGGWFSSSSLHTIVEDKESGDWFDIKFDADSGEYQYTQQEQNEITMEQKALLIDRALRQFSMTNSGTTPPSLSTPPSSGVVYASVLLGRCYFYYCQVGSFVLGTLGSIFGSSNATAEFKTKTNVWVNTSVSGLQILDRTSKITFSSKL